MREKVLPSGYGKELAVFNKSNIYRIHDAKLILLGNFDHLDVQFFTAQ